MASITCGKQSPLGYQWSVIKYLVVQTSRCNLLSCLWVLTCIENTHTHTKVSPASTSLNPPTHTNTHTPFTHPKMHTSDPRKEVYIRRYCSIAKGLSENQPWAVNVTRFINVGYMRMVPHYFCAVGYLPCMHTSSCLAFRKKYAHETTHIRIFNELI